MRKLLLTLSVLMMAQLSFSQFYKSYKETQALSFGLYEGGKGIVGVEYEKKILMSDVGIIAGLGLTSNSFGLTYHLENGNIESHYFSFEYNQVGLGNQKEYWGIGPFYNFRKINLTGSLGYLIRSKVDRTHPNLPHVLDWNNGAFAWSIGFYFVFE